MTPEAQRIAIAKECPAHSGWREFWCDMENECYGDCCEEHAEIIKAVPLYPTDLNAMHEAEKVLSGEQVYEYGKHLNGIMGSAIELNDDTQVSPSDLVHIACATAAQRAEAFLRTRGKWETVTTGDGVKRLEKLEAEVSKLKRSNYRSTTP